MTCLTSFDGVFGGIEVLVDLCEATVDIPQEDEADGGRGGHLTVLLVLEQPVLAVLHEQLVLAEARVDESVDEGGGEVLAGAVHVGATPEHWADVVQVGLVHLVRALGLHNVQLTRQVQEMVVQMAVKNPKKKLFNETKTKTFLSFENRCLFL